MRRVLHRSQREFTARPGRRPDELLAIEAGTHLHVFAGRAIHGCPGRDANSRGRPRRCGSARSATRRLVSSSAQKSGSVSWAMRSFIVARTPGGLREIARHVRSTPAGLRSTMPTIPITRRVVASGRHARGRSAPRRSRSWRSAPEPRPGSSRPRPPGRQESDTRCPGH